MKRILFVDCVAPAPYTLNTLRSYALGGTEATVLRVASGLAKDGYSVALFQLCEENRSTATIGGIEHVGGEPGPAPDVIVHLRTALFVEGFREEYPKARQLIWLHDNMGVQQCLEEPFKGEEVVCVSDWHADTFLKAEGGSVKKVHRIYNPVVTDGAVVSGKVPGRLGFFSSPHKGLEQVLHLFNEARAKDSSLSLVVGNPGYMKNSVAALPGVTILGELPHHIAMMEMAKCQVLFYPQTVFPETFGLVMAEANAVGTPVLAHDMGAASELLETGHNYGVNAVIDCTDRAYVLSMLEAALAPCEKKPKLDPRFALTTIVDEWKKLLEGNA